MIKLIERTLDQLYKNIAESNIYDYSTIVAKTTGIHQIERQLSNQTPVGDNGEIYELSSTIFLKNFNKYFNTLFAASCENNTPKIINLKGIAELNCKNYIKKTIGTSFELLDYICNHSIPEIQQGSINYYDDVPFFADATNKIRDKIMKFFEKYNDYVKITLGRDSRYGSYIRERETNIKKILDEMNNINKNIKSNADRETNFKEVMNSIDSLKRLFSDEFISKYQLTGVSSIQIKVEKLLKMTNEIKSLQLTKTFFEKSKGINLYYEKEQTKTNIELVTELKKDKYFYFTNTVKFIKEKFINSNRESTNTQINKMMNTYFNNTSNDFIEKVIIPAKHAINDNENIGCEDYFNTLVTKTRPSNDQKDPEYEINLYMEVIVGKIDYQNQQNITCNYRDQNLIQMYNELTSSPNEFEVLKKNNTIF